MYAPPHNSQAQFERPLPLAYETELADPTTNNPTCWLAFTQKPCSNARSELRPWILAPQLHAILVKPSLVYFYVEGSTRPTTGALCMAYGKRTAPLSFKSPAWQPGRPKLRSPDRGHFCLDPVCTHGCSRRSFSSIKSPPSASFPLEPVATAVPTTIVHIGQRHSGKLSRTSPCLRARLDSLYMRCSTSLILLAHSAYLPAFRYPRFGPSIIHVIRPATGQYSEFISLGVDPIFVWTPRSINLKTTTFLWHSKLRDPQPSLHSRTETRTSIELDGNSTWARDWQAGHLACTQTCRPSDKTRRDLRRRPPLCMLQCSEDLAGKSSVVLNSLAWSTTSRHQFRNRLSNTR